MPEPPVPIDDGRRGEWSSKVPALVAIAIGSVVLVGWWRDVDALKRVAPGLIAMKANTAVGFLLAGGSLWLLACGPGRARAALGLAATVGLLGGLTLFESLTGLDLGIDQLLASEPPGALGTISPGRMQPTTSFDFLLMGLSLALLSRERGYRIAQGLALASAAVAAAALIGYLYGVRRFAGVAVFNQMALHTSVGMIALACGSLLARPDRGLMAVISGDAAGGLMARRLLPVAVLVPIVLGGLTLLARRAGLYEDKFGTSVHVVATIAIFVGFIGWNAASLHRVDVERREAAEALRAALRSLEARVAEQARAELELRTSERRYRFLADAMPQIVWTARPDGVPDYSNRRWSDYSGTGLDRPGDGGWMPGLHPDDRSACIALWSASVRTGERFEIEYRLRRASDGAYRWHLGLAEPMRDPQGRIVQWVGTCTDIDDRKRAEAALRLASKDLEERVILRTSELSDVNASLREAMAERLRSAESLRQSEERFRGAFDDAAIGMALVAPDGRWLQVNPALGAIVGYSEEELLAGDAPTMTHPDDREADLGPLRLLLSGEVRTFVREKRFLRKGGEVVWTRLSASLVRDAAGAPLHIVAQIEDVSERRRAEAAMQRAKEAAEAATLAKSEFLANMSHEIRTPMNGILGMTELALETALSPEQREFIGLARSSAESLLSVINDILDFSKIEAGKLDLDPTPFDLRAAVLDTVALLKFRARGRGLELTCRVAPDVPEVVVGDAGRLRQVLVNLVGNAIKFTERGAVSLAVDLESRIGADALLLVSVADTGIGIGPEKRESIFAPFEQADGSTTRKYGGTGLGLTISARLVGLAGGRIWVEENPGGGSIFRFTTRLAVPDAEDSVAGRVPVPPPAAGARTLPAPAPEALSTRSADRAGLRVLLAEDHVVNQKVAVLLLEKLGHSVSVAGDGRQALEALEADEFDLVLMDLQMPEMDGFEAVAAIRARDRPGVRRVPVIAFTAYAMEDDRGRCLAAGFDGYLSKPIRPAELIEALDVVAGARPAP